MEITPMQRGLSSLLRFTPELESRQGKTLDAHPVPLPEHPFGLEVDEETTLCLVGFPGYTARSVENMLANVGYQVMHSSAGSLRRLRVMLVEIREDETDNHDVYYEVQIGNETYLCGGCTDCSGEGGMGKMRMDGVFELLSTAFGVPIETVTIPYRRGQRGEDRLIAAANQYRQENR